MAIDVATLRFGPAVLGALAAFAEFWVRSGILVYGDAAQTAHNIVASERLFRIGIATDLLGGAYNAIVAVAFYTMLKQVNFPLALLAAFCGSERL